jgi:hypothetical protein
MSEKNFNKLLIHTDLLEQFVNHFILSRNRTPLSTKEAKEKKILPPIERNRCSDNK